MNATPKARRNSQKPRSRKIALLIAACGLSSSVVLSGVVFSSAQASSPAGAPDQHIVAALEDAGIPLKQGELEQALLNLKNAVRLTPNDGKSEALLGLALLRAGDSLSAVRELRQAAHDHGPEAVIVPGLINALLVRGEVQQLLDEFPDPGPDRRNDTAPNVLIGRAIALQELGRAGEARASADRALSLTRDVQTLVARAMIAEKQSDRALARRLSDEATRTAPHSDRALILSVSLMLEDQQADKALGSINSFAKIEPDSANAAALRVEALIVLNRDAEARDALDILSSLIPDAPLVTYYKAILAARGKDPKRASLEAVKLPAEFFLTRSVVAKNLADIAIAAGKMETARAILAAFIARHPDASELRFPLAALQLGARDADAAIKTLEPLTTSNDAAVEILLAQAFFQLGRYGDAVTALEHSHGADRNDILKRELAASLVGYGDTSSAIQQLQQLIANSPGDWNVASPLIDVLIESGDLNRASDIVERTASSAGDNTRLPALPWFYRGQILMARGDNAGAAAAYTQALAADPKFLPALYYRSEASMRRGEMDSARTDLRRIIARDPKDVPAYMRLAQLEFDNGNDAEMRAVLDRARIAAPNDPAPPLALARYHLRHNQFDPAMAITAALLVQFPNDPDALAVQGEIWFALGKPDKALDSFQSLVASHPESVSAQVALAKAFNLAKDNLSAIDAAKTATRLAPFSTEMHSMLAGLLLSAGRKDEAVAVVRQFNTAHPGLESDLLLADTLIGAKKTTEAIGFLEQRFVANPSSLFVQRLSQLAVAQGDPAKARRLFSDWVLKHPDDIATLRAYASLLLLSGDQSSARKEFELLLKQQPDDPVALNDLGWIIQNEDRPRAIALLSHAAKIEPLASNILDTLGWVTFQSGDATEALQLLQRAYRLRPDDGEIGYHLAAVLDRAGKKPEAKSLLQSILARNLAFTDAEKAKQLLDTMYPRIVAIDPSILDRYPGRYQVGPTSILTISRTGNRLFAQTTGQEQSELFAENNQTFFSKLVDIEVTFRPNGQTQTAELMMRQNGRDVVAKRIY